MDARMAIECIFNHTFLDWGNNESEYMFYIQYETQEEEYCFTYIYISL